MIAGDGVIDNRARLSYGARAPGAMHGEPARWWTSRCWLGVHIHAEIVTSIRRADAWPGRSTAFGYWISHGS